MSARPLFTVRRAEPLRSHPKHRAGVLLQPGLPDGEELAPGEALRLRRPDGSALVVITGGLCIPRRREPHQGRRYYPVEVRSAVVAEDVPRGTEVWRIDARRA